MNLEHDPQCDVNDPIIPGKPCNCRDRVPGEYSVIQWFINGGSERPEAMSFADWIRELRGGDNTIRVGKL